MPELKNVQRKVVLDVSSFDLEDFIRELYGLSNFYATLESPNDTTHEIDVTEPDKLFDLDEANKILEQQGCEYYMLHTLMEHMARSGHIERGCYLVQVSW